MQTASLAQIRKELKSTPPDELIELINRLSRYKKENKELLSYLLFAAHDELAFVASAESQIADEFQKINYRNLFWARKGVRRILRLANKFIRFSGQPTTEIALRAQFCRMLLNSEIPITKSAALRNLYDRESDKIRKTIGKLHEDLQGDYLVIVEELNGHQV